MRIDSRSPVGDLVCERPGRMDVLERFGVDFCCGGSLSLAEACGLAACSLDEVTAALEAADRRAAAEETPAAFDLRQASLVELTRNIVETHHAYLKTELPRLIRLLDKVLSVHGDRHPELAEIGLLYRALEQELTDHLMKEEQILFPMIQQMETYGQADNFRCGSIMAPISVMEHDHDQAGKALRRLREVTHDYQVPEDGCATYRLLFEGLAALERDTHEHIHKENNILHPRAARLEAELNGAPGSSS